MAQIESADSPGLLDLARAGDSEAFGELCRIHETGLLRQAAALCGDGVLAEDLAQDTLVEAWKCLARYNGQCRFFTWLCAILLNRYRNTLRKKRPFPFSALLPAGGDELETGSIQSSDDRARPDQAVQLQEETALVLKCVRALPQKHQQVIYLRFYVGEPIDGIAAALDCSAGTVKSRLFHALEKLRAMKDLRGQFPNLEVKGGSL
jgi:RNA polymerase sigma-70 factor (ECF subfamily)